MQKILFLIFASLTLTFAPPGWGQPAEERVRLHVLLAGHDDAPDPADIVEVWDFSSPPPTPGLAFEIPEATWYFLPRRARGDFLQRLEANPDTPRARLERYIVVEYAPTVDLKAVTAALLDDTNIEAVIEPVAFDWSSATEAGRGAGSATNYGRAVLNIDRALSLSPGHALIGVVDTGLAVDHPALRAQDAIGQLTGGNFLTAYSLDIGRWPEGLDLDVDEREPERVENPDPFCITDPDGFASIDFVGHGTHVSGQIAGNSISSSGKGICRNCGISMWRTAFARCEPGVGINSALNSDAIAAAITLLGDVGAQAVNLSLGVSAPQLRFCSTFPNSPICDAIAYIQPREIGLVSASGNDRESLDFPATDPRAISVGGFQPDLALWDDSPGNAFSCPLSPSGIECGSNYTQQPTDPRQELLASAKDVFGLVYPGLTWNAAIGCGDGFGPGPANDGFGHCTGTSMSSPQIAGLVGVLRSVNPLVPMGDPETPGDDGIRDVLVATSDRAQSGLPWLPTVGYGRPDALAAVRVMLGKLGGRTILNRATPLFSFVSAGASDHAYTTTPQTALSFMINTAANYMPLGPTIDLYPEFPDEPLIEPDEVPRATIYVLTTDTRTQADHPDIVPLYLSDRARHFPIGCNPSLPSCNINNRDFLLTTGKDSMEALIAEGYDYRGVHGYVFERCAPEPSCIPEGAEILWRKCNDAQDDCAIFLESERATFEANGFTAARPAGFPMQLGYAYPNTDTDGDGLIDGFERLIGTNPNQPDSDGDGAFDGAELPLSGVPVSDPCDGPLASRCQIPSQVFEDRFEG